MIKADLTDESLMEAVKENNLDQLVPLFDRYQKPIYNFFLKLSGDVDASEDLVQNLFIRIMKYRGSYQSGHKFRTWIYQMARNLYYDHYRTTQKEQETFMRVDYSDHELSGEDDGYEEIEAQEEKMRVAMAQLPQDKREVLVMSRFQGMKYQQIAEIMDTSVSNVKVKAHRAINELRTIYFKMT